MKTYEDFLSEKTEYNYNVGFEFEGDLPKILFDFQDALIRWALRKGKAALFCDCGMGKTFMQLVWADKILQRIGGGKALIVAPLCVAKQTILEARKLDIDVSFVRSGDDVKKGINITNYEMIENFKATDAVILDESSILKSLAGKTKNKLLKIFKETPYKLCCTATPCPNDIAELGNHAEFLNIMSHPEMLASFFVNKANKGMGWIMKPHAKDAFYKWMASWAVCLNNPEDLGFDGSKFILPPISINPLIVHSEFKREGELFFTGLKGIGDRIHIRKGTVEDRVSSIIELIENSNEQWLLWCGLNNESDMLHRKLNGRSVNVQGSDSLEKKEKDIFGFIDGNHQVLVVKPRIAGFGMNFQNVHNMAFIGLSDSYESYYQCIRRSWRFGQKEPVNVVICITDTEQEIFENVKRKEKEARNLSTELIKNIEEFERIEIGMTETKENRYSITKKEGPNWTIYNGDCVDVTETLPENSIDFSVYSPPFISLYTYSATPRDMGNSKSEKLFFEQYGYLIKNLLNITKPGRNTAVHVSQVPAMLVRDGYIGLKDFRGMVVRAYQEQGWIYHGEIVIQKNPQVQAVRTKSKSLLFVQLKRDSSWLRPGLADYICLFRKPGENKIPILPHDISNEDWIKFAHPIWTDIRENHTLSKGEARSEDDEKHICPLQLDVIDRCIRLWSNQGEVVLSPFAGIGSEGYMSLLLGRKFIGIELKREYFEVAERNLTWAENKKKEQYDLF